MECRHHDRLAAILGHPDALILPTFAADTAVHVRRIGAVPEVIPTSCGHAVSNLTWLTFGGFGC
ncbi:MAG TPA: hypothetical protein VFO20_06245, partial [Propionibacteriaceae bacterium]|nr:hypothetical protein [Propionibacteriaceae bacterium]